MKQSKVQYAVSCESQAAIMCFGMREMRPMTTKVGRGTVDYRDAQTRDPSRNDVMGVKVRTIHDKSVTVQ